MDWIGFPEVLTVNLLTVAIKYQFRNNIGFVPIDSEFSLHWLSSELCTVKETVFCVILTGMRWDASTMILTLEPVLVSVLGFWQTLLLVQLSLCWSNCPHGAFKPNTIVCTEIVSLFGSS